MKARSRKARVITPSVPSSGWVLMLILLILEWLAGRAHAAVVVTPQISLVVYADKPMEDEQWTALSAALRQEFNGIAAETHYATGAPEVIRGDRLAPGREFDEVIPIYLHGECRVQARPAGYTGRGALGWVLRDHAQIQPFIHVDCARIVEVLGQYALSVNKDRRNGVMAEAISRVVVHEWLHIATQSSAHSREGIEKRAFGLRDLVPDYAQAWTPASHGK